MVRDKSCYRILKPNVARFKILDFNTYKVSGINWTFFVSLNFHYIFICCYIRLYLINLVPYIDTAVTCQILNLNFGKDNSNKEDTFVMNNKRPYDWKKLRFFLFIFITLNAVMRNSLTRTYQSYCLFIKKTQREYWAVIFFVCSYIIIYMFIFINLT